MTFAQKAIRSLGVALLAALTALAALALIAPAASRAAGYPDLRMPAPSDLHLVFWPVASGEKHYQLRFATRPSNFGPGALEVHRTPTPSGIADLTQRIYDDPVGFHDVPLGAVVFDPLDTLFPIPDVARYELWTARDYKRAVGSEFKRGRPIGAQDNVGHCVIDDEPIDPDSPHLQGEGGLYHACTKFVTGLSAGWRSLESWADDNQYIDLGLTPIADGDYVLRAIVDPYNLLWESPGKADPARESETANAGVTYFRIVGGDFAGIQPL